MKLRIISGALRGRFVTIPERYRAFRPTRERIRGSVADILSQNISQAAVADLCAGSGIFGFEMLSRGAKRVVFVENDKYRGKLIRQHAARFGVEEQCRYVMRDVQQFIYQCKEFFNIIYFDPPYDDQLLPNVMAKLVKLLSKNGILVYERRTTAKGRKTTASFDDISSYDRRRYGETEILLFKRSGLESPED
jgi:16S rRNA (guanine(966)-N(2))-methyltransferase RsmD